MTVNSILTAIEYFFTEVLFFPYNFIRSIDNWWVQNIVSFTFTVIGILAFGYWLNQLTKFKKKANS
ncbi:MAG: uracil phosphoribosyltransferase [Flavobacteriaceae bacterium]|nr:uracil phosphoribosyltransferase [Flavobacteriaceae bacterium]